jgi:uncharacterized protein YlxW (UPF0749 family)
MAKTRRPARKKRAGQVSDQQLLADSKKALKKAARTLETELKTVKSYIKDLDGHSSFTNLP